MKKINKNFLIIIISFSVFCIFFNIISSFVEKYIETHTYHIYIYNVTDENVEITINKNTLEIIKDKTFVMDRIFDNKMYKKYYAFTYNYKIKIGNKIIEKVIHFPSKECGSFSASGGIFSSIIIKKINESYDILFTLMDDEISINEKLKFINRKKITDIFNRDGLN
jgi:hypothetical protein